MKTSHGVSKLSYMIVGTESGVQCVWEGGGRGKEDLSGPSGPIYFE